MKTRIISSIILFPIIVAAVVLGGFWLWAFMLAVSLVGMSEFYKALNGGKHRMENVLGHLGIISYFLLISNPVLSRFSVMLFGMFIVLNLILFTIKHEKITPQDVMVNIFGFFYVGVLLSNVYLVRTHEFGAYFVWFIFISAWACDTCAYFSGMLFGKRKLAPALSPKKTIEGAIGGTLGAAVIGGIFGHFISASVGVNLVAVGALIGLFGAILAQFGDLSASAIKRHMGIKDYGSLIPGHGGILDRFDSVIFTAPMVYLVLRVFL